MIYKITPGRQRDRRSTRPTRRTRLRSPSTRPATCSSAPARRDACCASIQPAKPFVLLDSPFQEIHALRFDDKGRCTPRRSADAAARAAGRRHDARSINPRRRRCGCRCATVSAEITSIAVVDVSGGSGSSGAPRDDHRTPKGAVYRISSRRRLGSGVGVARRLAVRHHVRSERRADRRHRQQRQALPSRRRSAAADAAGARERPAGHRVLPRPGRSRLLRDRQSRQAVPALVRARTARHLRVRGARRADGGDAGARSAGTAPRRQAPRSRSPRARATPKRPTTPGAPGPPPTPTRTRHPSPARRRATCSGARR